MSLAAQCHPERPYHAKNLCKPCYFRKYFQTVTKKDPSYHHKNRERMAAYRRANPEHSREIIRRSALKRNFGITPEDYNRLLKKQSDVCRICNESDHDRRLAVDHDHLTGRIRGLLCKKCNRGIGLFKDDIGLLRAAVSYLDEVHDA